MDNLIIEYAPVIIVVICFLLREKVFVTPSQLAVTKEDILRQVKDDYATKEIVEEIKEDIKRIEEKIDKLTELLIK